jgi:hypothetical protein
MTVVVMMIVLVMVEVSMDDCFGNGGANFGLGFGTPKSHC